MTPTPEPDVRTIAARALHLAECSESNCVAAPEKLHWLLADAVLAAVTPVIRRQERATTADEIANDLAARSNADDLEYWGANEAEVLRSAAAIARSHSTQPTEEPG